MFIEGLLNLQTMNLKLLYLKPLNSAITTVNTETTNKQNANRRESHQIVLQTGNKLLTPNQQGTLGTNKKKISNGDCHFCGKPNWTMDHLCPAREAQCNNCNKRRHFAKVSKSKTVNRLREEYVLDCKTEPWPEIDQIQRSPVLIG